MKRNGFTLIELLVVIAIIGILATIGIIAYSNFTLESKKKATIANFSNASKFIEATLLKCDLQGGTINLNNNISINCDANNTRTNVNNMADAFMNYFLSAGFGNPYNENDPAIIRTGSGGDTINGRLRLDETECSSGSSKKKIALWYKVHDDPPSPRLFEMYNWCS